MTRDDPPEYRQALACGLIVIGGVCLAGSFSLSFSLWDYVGHQLAIWWKPTPTSWISYDHRSLLKTAIGGTVAFCGGSVLLGFGIQEFRANRRKSSDPG
jgi:hypothetical protein